MKRTKRSKRAVAGAIKRLRELYRAQENEMEKLSRLYKHLRAIQETIEDEVKNVTES